MTGATLLDKATLSARVTELAEGWLSGGDQCELWMMFPKQTIDGKCLPLGSQLQGWKIHH